MCAQDVLTRPVLLMADLSPKLKLMVCCSTWKTASAILATCYALVEDAPLLSLQDVLLSGESSGNVTSNTDFQACVTFNS